MSEFLKSRTFLLFVTMVSFLMVFVPYFVEVPIIETASTKLITYTSIANAFTIILAVYSQFQRGINIIQRRNKGWYFKAYMLTTILLMLVFAIFGQETGPYSWVMNAVIAPLSSINQGILVFYLSTTAARAFIARDRNSMILFLTGIIVLLYQAPFTMVYFPGIESIALYFTDTFAVAAQKVFVISVTIGAVVFCIRVLLGEEPLVLGYSSEES